MVKQVKTKAITASSVVGSAAFRAGIEDVQRGVERFDEFASKSIHNGSRPCAWDYERGRQFAVAMKARGHELPALRIGARVSREAISAYSQLRHAGDLR